MKQQLKILLFVLFIAGSISLDAQRGSVIRKRPLISKLEISPNAGYNIPIGNLHDFANNGYNVGISTDLFFSKRFGLGLDVNHQTNVQTNPFDFSSIPEDPWMQYSISSFSQGKWKNTTLGVGPTYRIGSNKFTTDIYSKGGVSLLETPVIRELFNISGLERELLVLDEEKITSFGLTSGIRFNYNFSDKISIFLNPQYAYTTANINYTYRDVNNASREGDDGVPFFDLESLLDEPAQTEQLSTSYFNVNAGVRFAFGGKERKSKETGFTNDQSNNCFPVRLISPSNQQNFYLSEKERPLYEWSELSTDKPKYYVLTLLDEQQQMLYSQKTTRTSVKHSSGLEKVYNSYFSEEGKTLSWKVASYFADCGTLESKERSFVGYSQSVGLMQALDDNGRSLGDNNGIAYPQVFKLDSDQGGGNKANGDGEAWKKCVSIVCRKKGVRLEILVPHDAITTGSTTHKILAYSDKISYYATASQVRAEFGTTAAPEVSDRIGYVSAASVTLGSKYCDKNGHLIYDQVVYEVSKTNPINYNGNTNLLHNSYACLDFDTYIALANLYNRYNGSFADVPTSCFEGCIEGGGGIDHDDPGDSFPTNAAGQEIDDITLYPLDEDGGGISPSGGGLIGHDGAPVEIATNPGIIWVDINGKDFKVYKGDKSDLSKKDFCFCADGTYCEGKPNCDCCPKKSNELKSTPANTCTCVVDSKRYLVISNIDCETACNRFKFKIKEHESGMPSGKRQHKPIKY